jgi:hypothetical protein
LQLPYLEDGLLTWEEGHPDLYMRLFSREHPRLFVLGLFETNAAGYKLFDNMADLIARAILAQRDRPHEARRLAKLVWTDEPDLAGGMHYVKSERHAGYLDFDAYGKQMNRLRRQMGWPQITRGHYDRARQRPTTEAAPVADKHPHALSA